MVETELLESELVEPEEILGMQPIEMEEIPDTKYTEQVNYEDNNQMDLVVVLQSDEGVEEFELYEICEGADGTGEKTKEENEQLHFEIVEGEDQDIHCRMVAQEEQIELIAPSDYVANDQTDPLQSSTRKQQQQKHPIHVKLPTVNVPRAGQKGKSEKSDLLNESNMSEKQLNEFIQEMIHASEPNADGKYECTICNEVVSNRYSLGPHVMRVHSKQKSKVCPFCDRAFTCTGDLTRHIRIHTNSKPFKCNFPDCTYAFRASGDLHKHLRRHQTVHDGSNRRFTCDLCERSFERNYDLKRHKMTHNRHEEGVGYQCEYCPKTFVRKVSNLCAIATTQLNPLIMQLYSQIHFNRTSTEHIHIDTWASSLTNAPIVIVRLAISPIVRSTSNSMPAKTPAMRPLSDASHATFA